MCSGGQFDIPRDNLMAVATMLPRNKRAEFVARLLLGTESFNALLLNDDAAPADPTDFTSFGLTVEQARHLKNKVDESTWKVLAMAVDNATDGVATVDWSEIMELTGVTTWSEFAKGKLAGLHRSLRAVVGVPRSAVLLWEGEEWEMEKGRYVAGLMHIDGPAVDAILNVSTTK